MKFINKAIVLFLLVGFTMTSCEDFIDVNENPNNPTSVPPSLLLPSAQGRLNYAVGGDGSRYTSIFTQHVDGVSRQFVVYQNYGLASSDTDNMWSSLYSGTLQDLKEIQKSGDEGGLNYYNGVSKVLEAYTMLFLTDFFGDVPYSEFSSGVLQPAYDSQASVYTAIFGLLTDAKSLLSGADTSGNTPGSDDLVYGGDLTKWVKFANAIEARAYLRQDNYGAALSSINNAYDEMSDEAEFDYAAGATTAAPWYQYIEQRDDIDGGANYISLLSSLNDPRDAFYGISDLTTSHPVFLQSQSLPYLSYEEAKFIEAEATFETSGAAAAKPIYLEAIKASFDRLGISDTDYATYIAQSSVNPGTISKEDIMTQKYIALYTDHETFTDWRRTGFPSLSPNSGSQVPRRYPYPQNELDFNQNTPAGVTIFDRVGWDN